MLDPRPGELVDRYSEDPRSKNRTSLASIKNLVTLIVNAVG